MLQAVTGSDQATYVEDQLAVARPQVGWDSLTDNERCLAKLAAQGLSDRQIAREAFLPRHFVDSELRQVSQKLGVTSRAALAPAVLTHLFETWN